MRNGWELADAIREWPRRGMVNDMKKDNGFDVKKVLRVDPFQGDQSDGFFVALFVRKRNIENDNGVKTGLKSRKIEKEKQRQKEKKKRKRKELKRKRDTEDGEDHDERKVNGLSLTNT